MYNLHCWKLELYFGMTDVGSNMEDKEGLHRCLRTDQMVWSNSIKL